MLTDRHTGTLPALFAISGESRIKGFFKIRFQAIPVLKIKEQTVQTWGGALLAPPPSPREPGVHVQMWARTQRRSRLKVGFSPSFGKQGSARAGTRHGGVGAARRRPLTSLTASCADSRVGSGAAWSAHGCAASSLTPACGRGTGDFLPLIVFEAPRVPQPATGADAFLLEDTSPQRVRPRLVTASPPSPTLRSLAWRRATPARRGAFPGIPGTVITRSCDCCGGAEASGGFTSSRLLMDRRWQSQRARGQPRTPTSPGVYVRQRAL